MDVALLDIGERWGKLNETLLRLVDAVPDDKLNWSPKPELHNFRGILLHVSISRHGWLAGTVRDGEATPDVLRDGQTKAGMQEQLRLSWERVARFIAAPGKLDAAYDGTYYDQPHTFSGHWIAFHLLEHDIHHRADIFHYLALLGVEHPAVETP